MSLKSMSPAQTYALCVGAVLVIVGIVGFFYESAFSSNVTERDAVFGILDVNGWHNVVHVATGALGLLAFRMGALYARQYAIGLGVVYLVVAIWGFATGDGDAILSIIPVNTEDNVLHLVIGLLGIGAWAISGGAERTAAAGGPGTTAAAH